MKHILHRLVAAVATLLAMLVAREVFELMRANQAKYKVAAMSRMLDVSPRGYYAWLKRPASPRAKQDARLRVEISASHRASHARW